MGQRGIYMAVSLFLDRNRFDETNVTTDAYPRRLARVSTVHNLLTVSTVGCGGSLDSVEGA